MTAGQQASRGNPFGQPRVATILVLQLVVPQVSIKDPSQSPLRPRRHGRPILPVARCWLGLVFLNELKLCFCSRLYEDLPLAIRNKENRSQTANPRSNTTCWQRLQTQVCICLLEAWLPRHRRDLAGPGQRRAMASLIYLAQEATCSGHAEHWRVKSSATLPLTACWACIDVTASIHHPRNSAAFQCKGSMGIFRVSGSSEKVLEGVLVGLVGWTSSYPAT